MTTELDTGGQSRRSLTFQAIALALGSFLSQLLVAVIYVLAARNLGPSSYGEVVSAIAVSATAIGFIDFGTSSLWTRELARMHSDRLRIGSQAWSKILVAIAVGGVIAGAAFAFAPAFVCVGVLLVTGTISQTLVVPLRADRRGELVAVLLLLERVFALAAFIALSFLLPAAVALWAALALGGVGLAIAAALCTPAHHRLRAAARPVLPWRDATGYGIGSAAISAQQLATPLLGLTGGAGAAGSFGAVNRWTQPLSLLANAYAGAALPFIARESDTRETRRLLARASWLLVLAGLACLAVVAAAPLLVVFLLGDEFQDSVVVLQVLAIGTIPVIMSQPLATLLQARRREAHVAVVLVCGVGLYLGLTAVLGTASGALGGAIAYLVFQTALLIALASLAWGGRLRRGGARTRSTD